jgi:hypothetical protein
MIAAPAEPENTNAEVNTARKMIRNGRLIAQVHRPPNGITLEPMPHGLAQREGRCCKPPCIHTKEGHDVQVNSNDLNDSD